VSPALTLRAGINHASNPIPDALVNPLFPATVERHYTLGLGWLHAGQRVQRGTDDGA
jgi:long-chain fatty acid transport protein